MSTVMHFSLMQALENMLQMMWLIPMLQDPWLMLCFRGEGQQRICAIYQKKDHTQFKRSKLTHVLKASFMGKNCSTLMIANISPASSIVEHTLSTCHIQTVSRRLTRAKARQHYESSLPAYQFAQSEAEEQPSVTVFPYVLKEFTWVRRCEPLSEKDPFHLFVSNGLLYHATEIFDEGNRYVRFALRAWTYNSGRHIEFEDDNSKINVWYVVISKIYFSLVRINIRRMNVEIIELESAGIGWKRRWWGRSPIFLTVKIKFPCIMISNSTTGDY